MHSQYAPLATRFVNALPLAPEIEVATPQDESRLIAAARDGDATAYGALVSKYQQRLCSSLWRHCGSLADAQDATQEAFLRAFLRLNTYKGAGGFYGWLHRIAVNVIVTEHRKRKTRLRTEQSHELLQGASETETTNPDERLLRLETTAEVQAALANLSVEHRTILVLREFEDCDYSRIAVLLALPLGTVRSRLSRAKLQLRARLTRLTCPAEPPNDEHDHHA